MQEVRNKERKNNTGNANKGKGHNQEVICVPSLSFNDLYFIFRNNGQEVAVRISDRYPRGNHKLTREEKVFFLDNII